MTLEALINECIAVKRGDKEFALFHWHDGTWTAEIGNPRADVSLGECDGEFKAEGETPIAAVRALAVLLKDQPLTRAEKVANERAGKVFDVITRTWIEPHPAADSTLA